MRVNGEAPHAGARERGGMTPARYAGRGHARVAPVGGRTCHQTRCSTERADGRNSLAGVYAEPLSERDAEANRPLRADRIKATYPKAVHWLAEWPTSR